ncbi:MAG: PBECR4 domain-containing protein [Acutalibacteraceae bacterium]
MAHYTKEKAIAVVTSCAKKYKENLADKSLLFLCMDKHKNVSHIEFTFDASNFLHLTGLKMVTVRNDNGNDYKLTATQFYNKCLDGKLSTKEFDFASDGTTALKLDVLPYVMDKRMSASMVGDYNSMNPRLYTEKLVGGVKACVGFVTADNSGRYVPNTVLKVDIRDYAENMVRVIAVFRKGKSQEYYSEMIYKVKNVDWKSIELPSELAYLKNSEINCGQ